MCIFTNKLRPNPCFSVKDDIYITKTSTNNIETNKMLKMCDLNKEFSIMYFSKKYLLVLITGFAISIFTNQTASSSTDKYLSPIALTASETTGKIFIAEQTACQIGVFDINANKITETIPLKNSPTGLVLSKDDSLLYVTLAIPDGKVLVIDPEKLKVLMELPAGHTPMSPTLSPDEKTLYVCNRFNNNVSIIDIASGKELTRIPVTREPVAQTLSSDGKKLFVANHLPAGAANVDYMTSVIDVIDTEQMKVIKSITLPNGAIDLRGICLSTDGKYVYVPSIFARFLVPTTQIERGWINTHALNLIDTEKLEMYQTVLLDDVDLGAANPWGVACSPDGQHICVTHSATHEVSIIDQQALLDKLSKIPVASQNEASTKGYNSSANNPANDLSFLTGIRHRIKLLGNSPRGIVIITNTVYTAECLSDSIGIINNLGATDPKVQSVALGQKKEPDAVRLGEIYFNDASLCFQQWQSCATCHPDGRTDAVNWDLLNDGIGNPKSTKSMLYSHVTPPVMISGIRDKAETAVRSGIRYIQFAVPDEEKASAIDEYLKSLRPIPSPFLKNGKLSDSAQNGKILFEKAGCAGCHSGQYYTDLQKYNVGTGEGSELDREFDTPTLIEVWRTSPYLYDGRATTINDVFTKFNTNNTHGFTTDLKEGELKDLLEYVMSL